MIKKRKEEKVQLKAQRVNKDAKKILISIKGVKKVMLS